jgi:hypothetical protein
MASVVVRRAAMSTETKAPALDPFEVGQITERLPAWELWEDGVEPAEENPQRADGERAA